MLQISDLNDDFDDGINKDAQSSENIATVLSTDTM